MIHSLAGGSIKKISSNNFAKVELIEGPSMGGIYWYITRLPNLEVGNTVLVPFGLNNTLTKAKVLRIDKNISSQFSPIPISRAKEIYDIVK